MTLNRLLSIAIMIMLGACDDAAKGGNSGDNGNPDGDTDSNGDTSSAADADADGDTDGDTDADADTDGDTDTDADADGDADGDADYDRDDDGWYPPFDCNDDDPLINKDMPEIPDDDVDNNCNGQVDEPPGPDPVTQFAELWYSSDNLLVYIEIDPADGSVVRMEGSEVTGLERGQNCITMLADNSLLGARLAKEDMQTWFYYIAQPPRDGSPVEPTLLGVMPDGIMLEGLYTDCDGRIYGMDTGDDDGSATGNRLLRFTGDVLAGEFDFVVVSDLSTASVADIDDMGPGIDSDGNVTDNPGFAIDTGNIYDFNYETGSGTHRGNGGTWGVHVLGGPLFDDGVSRLYLLDSSARLYEMDPTTDTLSDVLGTGPAISTEGDNPGWSGLAGPLTDCETGFHIN